MSTDFLRQSEMIFMGDQFVLLLIFDKLVLTIEVEVSRENIRDFASSNSIYMHEYLISASPYD